MSTCPHCKKEIDHLTLERFFERTDWLKEVRLYDDGDECYLDYRQAEVTASFNDKTLEFNAECPECKEHITADEDEAVAFLKGEVKP